MHSIRAPHLSRVAGYWIVIAILALLSPAAHAATFCVGTPFELTTALQTASSNGEDDVIRVVQGIYGGHFVYASSEARSLTIDGGYTADCASRVVNPANTVLDGLHNGRALELRAFSVDQVYLAVDGLTVQHGLAPGGYYGPGGGLFADVNGSLILTNNTITENAAPQLDTDGGGLSVRSMTLTLINNTITGNSATFFGGGLFVWGGTVTLINNTISQNAALSGGGVLAFAVARLTLMNNTISQNLADNGGGLAVYVPGETVTLINNTITQNRGGGLDVSGARVTLTNNTITENSGGRMGGGIALRLFTNQDMADIYNNIVWSNDAFSGADLSLENDGNGDSLPSPINLFHNDFDQSTAGIYMTLPFPIDASNLDNVDPLFVDAAHGDYHLQAASPVIDQGDSRAPGLPSTDNDGNRRIVGPTVDLGAFEFASVPHLTIAATPETLWPPNGHMVPVTLTGTMTDPEPGGSGVDPDTATYAVTDEYGLIQPRGPVPVAADGSYAVTIALQAARHGTDRDGRQYIITVSVQDLAGNTGTAATSVTVPHDQGH